jgi:GNAT superfamily N-acetyltransferase
MALSLLQDELALPRFDGSFWTWRYKAATAGEGLSLVAVGGGEVIGTAGAFPLAMACGAGTVVGWFVVDCAVRPSSRRQGVFSALAGTQLDLLRHRGTFTFAMANEMSRGVFTHRLGYRHVADVPYLWALTGRGGSWLSRVMGKAWPRAACRRALAGFDVTRAQSSDEAAVAAEACERGRRPRLVVARSAAFLEWRYWQHPWHEYQVLVLWQSGEPLGYVILRGQNIVALDSVDDDTVRRALICVALEHAAEEGISQLHIYHLGEPALRQQLARLGFVAWPFKSRPFGLYCQQPLMVRSLGEHDDGPWSDAAQWHLQMGDIAYGL